jgi:hypothetical protein
VPLLFDSVFLKGERNAIKGNFILQNITRINQLTTNSLMDLDADNLMTLSTDQVISADVFVNKFNARNITTATINEEQLSRNVALVNSENIIEGEFNEMMIEFSSYLTNILYYSSSNAIHVD